MNNIDQETFSHMDATWQTQPKQTPLHTKYNPIWKIPQHPGDVIKKSLIQNCN